MIIYGDKHIYKNIQMIVQYSFSAENERTDTLLDQVKSNKQIQISGVFQILQSMAKARGGLQNWDGNVNLVTRRVGRKRVGKCWKANIILYGVALETKRTLHSCNQ